MSSTRIIYEDKTVAFMDIATEKSIHTLTNTVNRSTNLKTEYKHSTTHQHSQNSNTSTQPPTLVSQLANLKLHVSPLNSQSKTKAVSTQPPAMKQEQIYSNSQPITNFQTKRK